MAGTGGEDISISISVQSSFWLGGCQIQQSDRVSTSPGPKGSKAEHGFPTGTQISTHM